LKNATASKRLKSLGPKKKKKESGEKRKAFGEGPTIAGSGQQKNQKL